MAIFPPRNSNKKRSNSTSSSKSTSSDKSDESITSLFESSLSLLGSLPVAFSSSSKDKPILHNSKKHGTFKLYLNNKLEKFEEIQLQSHLLWPSSPRLTEFMEDGLVGIKDESVLELGAGSALVSLLSARMGASTVEITDYPAPGILDAIGRNVECNLNEEERGRVSVTPLDWTDDDALKLMVKKYPQGFTRILAADTLWMGDLNLPQLRVTKSLLSHTQDSRIIIVAGLHTGRHVIRSFLSWALEQGFEIERAEEVDRREEAEVGLNWKLIMEGGNSEDCEVYEGIEEERRRWLLYAVLKWPPTTGNGADEHVIS